jgi:hypothetical protein
MGHSMCKKFTGFYCRNVSYADRTHKRKHEIDRMYVDGQRTQVIS